MAVTHPVHQARNIDLSGALAALAYVAMAIVAIVIAVPAAIATAG